MLNQRNFLRFAKSSISNQNGRGQISMSLQGVYDALKKKYLKILLLCLSELKLFEGLDEQDLVIDKLELDFILISFSYSNFDSEEVMLNISRTEIGNKEQLSSQCQYRHLCLIKHGALLGR
ncbi:meiosis-specific protein ASY1-like [Papaver somniferum]|uniref:meiosis-specific protein ASY1-like n=1 Tax=Papaver somniferum TaxID=3469 RepID=UPI000E6FDC93|nr:meiosis-specific protein ASY1-like [Papaver somniferum]